MEEIKRITSFSVDHDVMVPGFYISRIDGDVVTYDLRTRKPNAGDYMDNITMHSVEHMFATYARNSEYSDDIVYFGPMGCQTGFYLLVRRQDPEVVFELTKRIVDKILAYEGPVFGAVQKECGNYRNLSLESAKVEMRKYKEVLAKGHLEGFAYPV